MNNTPSYENSKAKFLYFVEDTVECGVVLSGHGIKRIRSGHASLVDTYAWIENNSVSCNIDIDPKKPTRLLVTKKQAARLAEEVKKPGYTLVPLKMYFKSGGLVKVLLGICKGKKTYDKREAIKDRDSKRDMQRTLKDY